MMENFDINKFKPLAAEVRNLMSGCPADIPARHYLQTVLLQRVKNMTSLEAERTVTDIVSGIDEFKRYKVYKGAGFVTHLDENTANAYKLLVNMLTVIRTRDKGNAPLTQEQIDQVRDSVEIGREVTEEALHTLCKEFENEFNQLWRELNWHPEAVKPVDANEVDTALIDEFWNTPDVELYIAVLLYIHKASGDEMFAQVVEDNRILGSAVSAGMSAAKIEADYSRELIDVKTWLTRVKQILMFLLAASAEAILSLLLFNGFQAILIAIGATEGLTVLLTVCVCAPVLLFGFFYLNFILALSSGRSEPQMVPQTSIRQEQDLLPELKNRMSN